MRPSALYAAILTLGITMFPATSRAQDAPPPKIVEYTERVAMNTGEIRKANVCLTIYPNLESDDFFKGLQRIDRDGIIEFHRYSRTVSTYPAHLTIQIVVSASICDADVYTPVPIPDYLNTLHFKVQWKRGLYLRSVEKFSVESVPTDLETSPNRRQLIIPIHDEHDVPLTDHLILTVLSSDGKILSRMAARL